MRTKKKKFAGALTLAGLFSSAALMVGGPPIFAVSADVVVCAQQGAQAQGGSAQGQSRAICDRLEPCRIPDAGTLTQQICEGR
jgi:hypothetical protein